MTGDPSADMADVVVSVIIPARNAATTLGETLDSLLAQTFDRWEAVVVDDGSTDATRMVAESYAEIDARIRVVASTAASEGGARNAGLDVARGTYTLFLDADDRIDPSTLSLATDALRRDPAADGVVYGWATFTSDGDVSAHDHWEDQIDPVLLAARQTPFLICACVVRRSVVDAVGRFDPALRAAADWDLWLRVLRSGARLVRLSPVLGYYRSHPGSMSADTRLMLEASMVVLDRAYAPDPRVSSPDPRYEDGAPLSLRPAAVFRHLCWWGGAAIASGDDALELVEMVESEIASIDDVDVGELSGVAAYALRRMIHGQDEWDHVADAVGAFLQRLETVTGVSGLAWRTQLLLSSEDVRITVAARHGDVQAVALELTEPIDAIELEAGVGRVVVVGRIDERQIGTFELPARGGRISRPVLIEAVLREWSWDVCAAHIKRRATVPPGADGDQLWAAFVEDLWLDEAPHRPRHVVAGLRPVDVVAGQPLPRVLGVAPSIRVHVGTTRLDAVPIARADARNRRRLAIGLTVAYGQRLVEAVAREVLLERTTGASSLLQMLARAALGRRETAG